MMQQVEIYKNTLFKAVLNGARAVINKEKTLNEINVFPVKDADTGSNLKSMMDSIIYKAKLESTLKDTLESISNAALLGSKGNSGLIFSQFMYGLSKDIDVEYFDFQGLKNQIRKGYEEAYQAIDKPVEGTMITLMRKFYHLLDQRDMSAYEFNVALLEINKALKLALEETKNQLSILKKNNVIDAGALAFSTFVDGFVKSLTDENYTVISEISDHIDLVSEDLLASHEHEMIHFRYCTEVLIETEMDKKEIKELLSGFGDSLVIGQSNKYYRIHMHTNEPDKMIENVSQNGMIIHSKVDDMKNQYMLKHERKYDIGLLTDSIADIDKALIDQYQIQVHPLLISADGNEYFDKKSINNKRILDLIDQSENFPKSAAPSSVAVMNQLNQLMKVYKMLIILTVSSKMSATYQVFKNAVKSLNNENIVLIDTKQNSVAEGLITYHTAKMIAQGLAFETIVKKTEEAVSNAKILVQVPTLDNMVKSGRISKRLGRIATKINLKPIVSINENGEGIVLNKVLGQKTSLNKILKHIKKVHKASSIKSYGITYVDDLQQAEYLKTKLVKILGFLPEYITQSSSVIAMSAGRSAVAVGYIKGGK